MFSFIDSTWETPFSLAESLEATAKRHSTSRCCYYDIAVDAWIQQSNKDQKKLTSDWQFVSGSLRTAMSSPRLHFKKVVVHMLHFKHAPKTALSAFLNQVIVDSVTTDH